LPDFFLSKIPEFFLHGLSRNRQTYTNKHGNFHLGSWAPPCSFLFHCFIFAGTVPSEGRVHENYAQYENGGHRVPTCDMSTGQWYCNYCYLNRDKIVDSWISMRDAQMAPTPPSPGVGYARVSKADDNVSNNIGHFKEFFSLTSLIYATTDAIFCFIKICYSILFRCVNVWPRISTLSGRNTGVIEADHYH
jgi:hypothetical protein